MQIMERPGKNYKTIKLVVDGEVFKEFNLPSNENGQLLFENNEDILANEKTCEKMEIEGGFTRIQSKPRCQMDLNLISKEERNKVALTLLLRKQSN